MILKATLLFVTLVLTITAKTSGGLVVESWDLASVIIDPITTLGDDFQAVENPFVDSHSVSSGLSIATTSYDFSWSDSGGDFLIQGSQRAHDTSPPFLRSISNGRVDLISSVDLLFTAEGSYTYDLPAGAMAMAYSLGVLNDQFDHAFFSQGINVDSFLNGSAGGTFIIDGQAILPAGQPLHILYSMTMDAYDSSGLFATGSGYFHFTLQEVPEPSTLGLAILGTAFLLRRRAR